MSTRRDKQAGRVCPKTGRPIQSSRRYAWLPFVLPIAGLLSLVWFLIRVIPKPSRAAYPCQRVAFPLASGFVVWLTGMVGSILAYRRARQLLGQSRYVLAALFMVVAVAAIWWSVNIATDNSVEAAFTPTDPPNSPMGVGKGIHPGRVVWMYEPRAATWDGETGRWWEEGNTDQPAVDYMVSKSLQALTGEPTDVDAWGALFRHFNATRGLGDLGYQRGETIAIKINMNQDSGGTWSANAGMPSPQMLYSVVDQLINVAGVPGSAITIYDASRYIGDPLYNKIRGNPDPEFQQVTFAVRSNYAGSGRLGVTADMANPIRFAGSGIAGGGRAYPPRQLTQANYLINMALFRAHQLFGVTFCAKNHFGSMYWQSNGGWTPEPLHNFGSRNQAMGSYNCLVDLIGHPHLGGKTLIYMIDGVYGARHQNGEIMRYASFNDGWTSSIFVSQDPVAIDSVALDFVRNEPRATDCTGQGVDNYLHEAALANDPPSRSVYDPDGDGKRLESLGVHEHWNNAAEKKYSRNLGMGEGIELVVPALTSEDGPVENRTQGKRYDVISHAIQEASEGDEIVVAPGVYNESVSFGGKAVTVRSEDPNDPAVVAATVIDGGAQSVSFNAGEDAASVLAGFTVAGATRGIYCQGASPTIRNCRVVDNVEAGIKLWESSNPTIVNCVIAGNGGDGIEMWATKSGRMVPYNFATIAYCTIVGNGGSGVLGSKPILANTIVCSNGVDPTTAQIAADAPVVNYCDVEGGFSGTGNIDVDPGFVLPGHWADPTDPTLPATPGDPAAVWIHGDYHLRADSPCIDAGDPASGTAETSTDIDGQPRIVGGRADIGCDELSQPVAITWFAHASVKLGWKDTVIYVDPRRLSITPHDATLILVTHSHGDHYSPSDIAKVRNAQTQFIASADVVQSYGSGQSIAPGQTIDAAGVRVIGVASYNITKTNHPKSRNWVGFIVEVGGRRIYLAGDTDLTEEMKALTDIDVAFLPAGGTYTMDAVEAAQATTFFKPTLAIPYHWGTSVGTRADAETFAARAACNVKVMAPGETITTDDLDKDFSLVAHWKLDETQGSIAGDSAGNYDGTLEGGPTWKPNGGQLGGALELDGIDDCITTPFILSPSAGPFSLFAWIKGGMPGQAVLSQANGSDWLAAGTTGTLMTQLRQSGRNSQDLASQAVVTDGEWYRVGVTWDGSQRTLYVDDVKVAGDAQTGLTGSTTGLYIGAGSGLAVGSFWSGLIDDVRIHTRVVEP